MLVSDVAEGVFSYNGALADWHRLSARDLGPALVGLDAIVSSLFKMLETGVIQRKKPRDTALILTVAEPRAGSYELVWVAQTAPALLPLWPHFSDAIQAKLVEHFVNYVMLWFGGRRREAEFNMDRMLDLLAADRDASYADRQRERDAIYEEAARTREHTRQLLHDQAQALHGAAKFAVTPVGRSATSFMAPLGYETPSPRIDEATADAIRAKEELTVSELVEMTFRIEGLRDQKKIMFVYDPEDETRIFPVVIVDPEFESSGNAYKRAFANDALINLTGKTTRHSDGKIKTFHAISATSTG